MAAIVGPTLGGLIYGLVPIEMFLLIAGICFILSAISETFINFNFNNTPVSEKSNEKIWSEIKSGLNYVKSKKAIFSILAFSIFTNFVFSAYTVSLPHIINIQLGFNSEQYGLIQSSSAIGSLIFSIIYSLLPDNKSKYKHFISALVILSILMMITGIPTLSIFNTAPQSSLLLYFILLNFSIGGALMFVNLPAFILIQRETSDEYRGRVNGLFGTMSLSIQPLGMTIGGLFTDYISSFILVLICGILSLAISFILSRITELKEGI
jgi:MFS family permease